MPLQSSRALLKRHGQHLLGGPSFGKAISGIVTDRDLVVEIYALDLDPTVITIGDIMTTELVTVPESFGVMETTQLMRMKGIRRVPVVDGDGNLVGIVTVDDVLQVLAEELTEVARTVPHEQSREVRMRM